MSTRVRALAWILSSGVWLSCPVTAQDLPEAVLIERALRDGPRARAIRAEVEVTEHEQAARLAWSNPSVLYSREGAGFTEFLQVEQALPAFGVRTALSKLGVTAAAAAAAERDARLWDLRADVRVAAAYLRAAERRRSVAEAHLRDSPTCQYPADARTGGRGFPLRPCACRAGGPRGAGGGNRCRHRAG